MGGAVAGVDGPRGDRGQRAEVEADLGKQPEERQGGCAAAVEARVHGCGLAAPGVSTESGGTLRPAAGAGAAGAGGCADGADQSRARIGEIVREPGGEMRVGEVRGSGARGAAGGLEAGAERSTGGAGGDQRTDLWLRLPDRTSVQHKIQRVGEMFVAGEWSGPGDDADVRADDREQGSIRA